MRMTQIFLLTDVTQYSHVFIKAISQVANSRVPWRIKNPRGRSSSSKFYLAPSVRQGNWGTRSYASSRIFDSGNIKDVRLGD